MKVGCFALVDPFSLLDHQLERVAGLGFKYADVTDNHPGGLFRIVSTDWLICRRREQIAWSRALLPLTDVIE